MYLLGSLWKITVRSFNASAAAEWNDGEVWGRSWWLNRSRWSRGHCGFSGESRLRCVQDAVYTRSGRGGGRRHAKTKNNPNHKNHVHKKKKKLKHTFTLVHVRNRTCFCCFRVPAVTDRLNIRVTTWCPCSAWRIPCRGVREWHTPLSFLWCVAGVSFRDVQRVKQCKAAE